MKTIFLKSTVFAVAIILTASGCRREGCTDPEALNYDPNAKKDNGACTYLAEGCTDRNATNYDPEAIKDDGSCTYSTNFITFRLNHSVDGAPLVLNDMRYTNEAGNNYSVITLVYYISDITLHKTDGSKVKKKGLHYRDIDDATTATYTVTGIPDGEYSGISFVFGLDSVTNQTGNLPNEDVHNNMEWPVPLGGGYHYMKLEGRYRDTANQITSYNTHMGRGRMIANGDTTFHENFINTELLNSALTVSEDGWEIELIMNLNEWYKNPNAYNFNTFGSAIMMNQNAQQTLKENGADIFSIGYKIRK